jgi:hypothetical protein
VFLALLMLKRLARGLACQLDEERRHLDQPRRSARCDGDPPKIGQEEAAIAPPVLTAHIDRDVFAFEPRTRRVPDLSAEARGVTDDLRQQIRMVAVVIHLAKIGCEHAGRFVPDLTGHAPLPRVTGPNVKDLMRQIARADPLALHQRPAKHIVHPGCDGLSVAGVTVTHGKVDDVRQNPAVHEHLSVCEVRRLDAESWMSLGVDCRLSDQGPQPVAERVLAPLPALAIQI